MNAAVHTLQVYFSDPRHAQAARWGCGALLVALLAGLAWVAVSRAARSASSAALSS